MCLGRSKSSKKEKSKETQKSHILLSIYILLFILLVGSLLCEYITGNSFMASISTIKCPIFLQSHAVFEIIKIIGFSNIFIGWIYASLDRKILGISYLDVLQRNFPCYTWFSSFHIVATLCCIAISSSGLSESSLISLAIVLIGLIYQGYVCNNILLNADKCEKLAKRVWKERKSKTDDLQLNLLCLVRTIPYNDSRYYREYIKNLCELLIEFAQKNDKSLKTISQIWEELSSNTNPSRFEQLTDEIFQQINVSFDFSTNTLDRKTSLCRIINGYIIFQISNIRRNAASNNINKEFEVLIHKIKKNIDILFSNISYEQNELKTQILNRIETNLFLLLWILFQSGEITLTQELINIAPENNDTKDFDEDEMVQAIFPDFNIYEESLKRYINIAKTQL